MAVEHISGEHIKYLVQTVLSPPNPTLHERAHTAIMLQKAGSARVADRVEVIHELERRRPGITSYLADLWWFNSRRSLYLYTLPFLEHQNVTQALVRTDVDTGLNRWQDVEVKAEDDDPRVIKVRVFHREISAKVRLTKTRTIPYEGKATQHPYNEDVELRLTFHSNNRLIEVYSDYVDARQVLRAFLVWTGVDNIPRRKSAAQQQIFSPVCFTEKQVKILAERIGLENVALKGKDPTGDVGERHLLGERKGYVRQPLNSAVLLVKQHEASMNQERAYNLRVKHEDGFNEVTEVSFAFTGKQPRITFNRRASRTAVDYLVSEVYKEVGRS